MKRFERTNMVVLATFAMGAGMGATLPVSAAGESAEQAVRRVERESVAAALHGDVAVLGRILADDYVSTTAGGEVRNKSETLANYRSGHLKITALTVEDTRLRIYGQTAVMTGRSTIRGISLDGKFNGVGRFTRVFVNLNGRWQVVADESTPMPEITNGNGRIFIHRRASGS